MRRIPRIHHPSWLLLGMLTFVAACGGEDGGPMQEPSPDPPPPDPPNIELPTAGVTPWACEPGEVQEADGSCTPPGIEDCGAGFELADDGGCEAVLPEMPCGPGTMAIPGETACRPVAPCGSGPWGDIPVEASTIYVDAAQPPGGDGSAMAPFDTLDAGIAAAPAGGMIAMAAGTYPATTLGKPLRLWGRCPAMVTFEDLSAVAVVEVLEAASGAELHGVTVRGGVNYGVFAVGPDLALDRVSFENNPTAIRLARSPSAPDVIPTFTVDGVLVDGAVRAFAVSGSVATIDGSVFRNGVVAQGAAGVEAVRSISDVDAKSTLTLRRSVIDAVVGVGLYIWESDATVEETVISNVIEPTDLERGTGISAFRLAGDQPLQIRLDRVVVERAPRIGVFFQGAIGAEASNLTVRHVQNPATQTAMFMIHDDASGAPSVELTHAVLTDGAGIGIQQGGGSLRAESVAIGDMVAGPTGGASVLLYDQDFEGRASFEGLGLSVARGEGTGIVVKAAELMLESAVVRNIASDDTGGKGRGIAAFRQGMKIPNTTLDRVLVARTVGSGIAIFDSDADLRDVEVAEIGASASGERGGGIAFQSTSGLGGGRIVNSTIRDCARVGLSVDFGDAGTLEVQGLAVSGTTSTDGGFGDGVFVLRRGTPTAADPAVALANSVIRDDDRSGVVALGSAVSLSGNAVLCHPISLIGEPFGGQDSTIADAGGNLCGCDAMLSETCQALSSSVSPPSPLQEDDPGTSTPNPM